MSASAASARPAALPCSRGLLEPRKICSREGRHYVHSPNATKQAQPPQPQLAQLTYRQHQQPQLAQLTYLAPEGSWTPGRYLALRDDTMCTFQARQSKPSHCSLS